MTKKIRNFIALISFTMFLISVLTFLVSLFTTNGKLGSWSFIACLFFWIAFLATFDYLGKPTPDEEYINRLKKERDWE